MDKQIGPYQIVRLIGSGGMGSVYEAFHPQINRRAAIKLLHKELQQDQELVQRFYNEARAVNIIDHPTMVAVYDFGSTEDGAPYIVMEHLEGETLRQRLAAGPLSVEAALYIGRQLAAGLAAAHARQVVHRDLKPVNIMIVPDAEGSAGERARILDFGIAKLAADPRTKALTRMGASMGTPAYSSPEQCRSARDVSDRSDVYSLGIVLFEALAGEHPFAEARSDSAMMGCHIGREPPPLASKAKEVPPELAALIHRTLRKRPEERPSAAEVAMALSRMGSAVTASRPVLEPAAPSPPATDSEIEATLAASAPAQPIPSALRARSGKLLIAAAAAALVLGLGGLIWVGRTALTGWAPVPLRDLGAAADLAPPAPPDVQEPPGIAPPSAVPIPAEEPSHPKDEGKDESRGTKKPRKKHGAPG